MKIFRNVLNFFSNSFVDPHYDGETAQKLKKFIYWKSIDDLGTLGLKSLGKFYKNFIKIL